MARASDDDRDTAGRIGAVLDAHPAGMHRVGEPATVLDMDYPEALTTVLREFNGAELFHEAVILLPSREVERVDDGPDGTFCYLVGEVGGDDIFVDARGRVFRLEEDTGEWLEEGSRYDRWLLGAIEAEELLYDRDGEFREDAFEDTGELATQIIADMQRRVLRRDRHAPAPRWRLAQALLRQGKREAARDELEQVVAHAPRFAWAWFDLARISEELGQMDTAIDEYVAAAEARPDYEHAGFFWAHAARVAQALGNEARRADYASRALARDPDMVRTQQSGAAETLEAGDAHAALRLAEVAAALQPRDLRVLDLLTRIRARIAEPEPEPEPQA